MPHSYGHVAYTESAVPACPCALELSCYTVCAGDVWEPQPPPKDHPWRSMPHNGMTPHYAGNTIDAQRR